MTEDIEKIESILSDLRRKSEDAANQRAFDAIKVQIGKQNAVLDYLKAKQRGSKRAEQIKAQKEEQKEEKRVKALMVDYRDKLNELHADWQKSVRNIEKLCTKTHALHNEAAHALPPTMSDFIYNFRPINVYEHLAAVLGTSATITSDFLAGIRRTDVPMVSQPLSMKDFNLKETKE